MAGVVRATLFATAGGRGCWGGAVAGLVGVGTPSSGCPPTTARGCAKRTGWQIVAAASVFPGRRAGLVACRFTAAGSVGRWSALSTPARPMESTCVCGCNMSGGVEALCWPLKKGIVSVRLRVRSVRGDRVWERYSARRSGTDSLGSPCPTDPWRHQHNQARRHTARAAEQGGKGGRCRHRGCHHGAAARRGHRRQVRRGGGWRL